MTFKRIFVGAIVGVCLLAQAGFSQESPQDQYLKIYLLIQEADKLETAGQKASAHERYKVSNLRLRDLQNTFPNWEPTIVKFRIKYTDDKIIALADAADENPSQVIAPIPSDLISTPSPVPAPSQPMTPAPTEPVAPTLTASQQLDLQAPSPLAEPGMSSDPTASALSANAALVNATPDEMKSRIRDLESQLDMTRSQLETARTEAAQLRSRVQDLESKIKVAMEGTTDEKIAMMMQENQRLKDQLAKTENMIGGIQGDGSSTSVMNLKEQVDKIQGQLQLAKQENSALRQTNEEYRQKLADVQAKLDEATSGDQISTLQEENDVLRSIVNRQLKEQARRDIAKRLALEELNSLAIDSAKLETQLDILGSPLVNLTEEEKAMLRRPTAGLVVESTGEISAAMPGSDAAMADDYASRPRVPSEFQDVAKEANSLFQQGKFDEAAAKYQSILNTYPESLYAVSNIAVVRFQQGNYPVAEQHLRKAVKLAPQDAFSHSILGIVLYQQGKFDEAVQILSRASALDPNDPKTRNYLGISASQKGWQEAAEQECRKAIELDPQYGDAHFNLAVIYATQKPPAKELSKRHYNRALELGVPRDSQLEALFQQ
ncbi:MAG: tetratricopeptide repeat protein [Verrucomicrobiota bacterium]